MCKSGQLFYDQTFENNSLDKFLALEDLEFEGCLFRDIKFMDTKLASWRFIDCKFERCSFSKIRLIHTRFRDTTFSACRLLGVDWTETHALAGLTFSSCKLDFSCFQEKDLRKTFFVDCSITDADFSDVNLSGADFSNSTLKNSVFTNADLSYADLRNAQDYTIDPKATNLNGALVSFPEAASFLVLMGMKVSS